MAADWLMLETFTEPQAARLRFYGWSREAFTFGYGQKWTEARAASGLGTDLVRRPTGGGLVDHRQDWTYALVLPAMHPLAQAGACESYRAVHEALVQALKERGAHCKLQVGNCKSAKGNLAVCFQKAEMFDIVREDDGRKIAGAAQKRTRKGLLFQGSVDRSAATEVDDWKKLDESFVKRLAETLDCKLENWARPSWPEATLTETAGRFGSKEWNEKR